MQVKPYKKRAVHGRVAVADFETEGFRHGRVPSPICIGFYDGERELVFWGGDCVSQFRAFLLDADKRGERYTIFMHNGGRFDFMYLLSELDLGQQLTVINGRIVRAYFMGHEFRDSWALFPQPLSSYQKTPISYDLFELDKCDAYRDEISRYCLDDCRYVRQIIEPFLELFGDVLTVGSAAINWLESMHGFARIDERDDTALRAYYYGGRVQPFEIGDFSGAWKLYDVNSMYPSVMKNVAHPIGNYTNGRRITERTAFAKIDASSKGCLPLRDEKGRLTFPHTRAVFYATAHEIRAGLELGLLQIHEVLTAVNFADWSNFAAFVDDTFGRRADAKKAGDKALDLIWKRVGNSAYGKFAIDPRRFKQYLVLAPDDAPSDIRTAENLEGWFEETSGPKYRIWERPSEGRLGKFLNVATAASITGAARSILMRGLAASKRPIYCDTDSIICEGFSGDVDAMRLGAWDLEAEADRAVIAAKKIYALFRGGECIKKAAKGARLSAEQICEVARGGLVHWASEAPNYSFTKSPTFVSRKISRLDLQTALEVEDNENDDD